MYIRHNEKDPQCSVLKISIMSNNIISPICIGRRDSREPGKCVGEFQGDHCTVENKKLN
jgi:hypothetical protein